jgi:sortase A
MNRVLRVISTMLVTAGVVVLADVGVTLAWKEPVSSIYGEIQQGKAEDELADLESRFPSNSDLRKAQRAPDITGRVEILAKLFAHKVDTGQAIGRIRIPAIDLDVVFVQGTDTASLQKGPGHYPDTAFPGQGKTIGIAGHRTTYLAPFRHLDQLQAGDEILLEMPYANFTYTIQKTKIVEPTAVQIVDNVGYERLVLTACNPLYSASQRIAAFAKLTDVSLFAAGDARWNDP